MVFRSIMAKYLKNSLNVLPVCFNSLPEFQHAENAFLLLQMTMPLALPILFAENPFSMPFIVVLVLKLYLTLECAFNSAVSTEVSLG